MEPDINKILSARIHTEEQNPVTWNKASVWEQIQEGSAAKKAGLPWYHYAAATVALLIVALIGVHHSGPAPISEPSPVSQYREPVPMGTDSVSEAREVIPARDVAPMTASKRQRQTRRATEPERRDPPDTTMVEPGIQHVAETVRPVAVSTEAEPAAPVAQKVTPVIGVNYAYEPVTKEVRGRKKGRARESEPESVIAWEDDVRNRIVIARRK